MTKKQKQFARTRLFYRPQAKEYGYYYKGTWVVMGKGSTAEWLTITDGQLFGMYLKHKKSLKVAESR